MLVTQVVFVLLKIHCEASRAVFPGLMLLPGSWHALFREFKDAKFFHLTVFCMFEHFLRADERKKNHCETNFLCNSNTHTWLRVIFPTPILSAGRTCSVQRMCCTSGRGCHANASTLQHWGNLRNLGNGDGNCPLLAQEGLLNVSCISSLQDTGSIPGSHSPAHYTLTQLNSCFY